MIASVDDIVTRIVGIIKANNANIVPKPGSIVHDGFVLPGSTALSWDSALQAFSQAIQSLDQILILKNDTDFQVAVAEALGISVDAVVGLLSASIDRKALDHRLTRKPPTKATSLAYYFTTNAPAEDSIVPAGSQIQTPQGVQYTVTTSVVLLQSQLAAYYDPALLAYAIAAPVEANISGPGSNVAAGQLIYPVGTMPNNFTGVTNKYLIDNGYEAETDEQFVDRIKTTLAGTSLQTANGMKALILNNTDVRTVFIADASSPFQIRNSGKGGVVDIYTLDNIPALVSDIVNSPSTDQYLAHQPVIDIVSVIGTDQYGVATTFTEGSTGVTGDYYFVKDTNPISSNSVRAFDKISWPGALPTSYVVSYAYNQVLSTVQALVTEDENRPLMGDITTSILTRQGTEVPVEISYQIVVFGNYSRTEVIRQAVNNITAYVNGLTFGASLAQSDIINVLENTPGINSVETVPITFNRVGGVIEEIITANAYEYLRASSVVIV